MTDEEKVSIRDLLKTADIDLSERQTNILCRAFELSITKGYEQGFAEGKPKWHDLRKDPNDLPKHSGLYCTQGGEVREFDKEEQSWFTVHFVPCMNCTEDTYAWCEIPKFEEKK